MKCVCWIFGESKIVTTMNEASMTMGEDETAKG